MLKRISVQQLTIGMHLKEFCGSWMEHPFWRTSFVITDPNDIVSILASSIKEVWIDCSKGLDVPAGVQAVSQSESEAQVDAQLHRATEQVRQVQRVPMDAELAQAVKICAKSKQAVASMFHEARMGKSVDTEAAQHLVQEISDSVSRNPGALISLARLKTADDYTYMHSVAVCALMISLAKQLSMDDTQTHAAGIAGLLHDLGKALIPMTVLNKPGKLTDAEFQIVKNHPLEGYRMLQGGNQVHPVALDVCLHHHEKMDGSGYPDQLKGDAISLFARMGAVCDVYDAITSNRPYKEGWDPAESLRKMAEWTKGHFDPTIFQAFVKSLGIYPVGSLLRLSSGRLGMVVEQSEKSLLTPLVKVFFSIKSNLRIVPEVVDLSLPDCTDKIAGREDPDKWRFPDINELWSGVHGTPW